MDNNKLFCLFAVDECVKTALNNTKPLNVNYLTKMKQNSINLGYIVFLACASAIGGFLFGYDTAVISGTISAVAEQFGLDTMQIGWYVGCALVGSIAGVALSGMISDKMGRKRTMILSAILFSASAIGCAFTPDFAWLVVWRIVGGMGIGVTSIVCPLYISEVSISRHRGLLVSCYQLAITIGFLAAYLANYGLLKGVDAAAGASVEWFSKLFSIEVWRGMLGMETIPALLYFVTIMFIPESPRWLVLRKREENAERILQKTLGNTENVTSEMKAIREVSAGAGKSDWKILLRKPFFAALVWGVLIAILGQFMGVNAVLYYGPTIFEQSGLSSNDSLFYQVLIGMANMMTTVVAMLVIDRVGRKRLIYFGVTGMISSLLLIAAYFVFGTSLGIGSIPLLVFFLMYIFFTAISISAVVFVLLSEMYPMRVRGLAMSIAGFSLWIGTYLIGQLTPWMLEVLSPAGTFVFFAVMCLPYMWIMWKKIPETAGRSLEDIEKYWTSRSERLKRTNS